MVDRTRIRRDSKNTKFAKRYDGQKTVRRHEWHRPEETQQMDEDCIAETL